MYSELIHSSKLSKRLQRDSQFHEIFYNENFEIEAGLKEVKYLKDNESIFSQVSNCDTVEKMYENVGNADATTKVMLDSFFQFYKNQKDNKLKKRLANLKWVNKKLELIPMTLGTTHRLPNPMKEVIFGNYTFVLDSAIFSDHIDEKSKEYPAIINGNDLLRVRSAIYDSNNNVFIAEYDEIIASNQQNLFVGQQKCYYLDWLNSLGNNKAKEMAQILNRMSQSEKKDQENCYHYTSTVSKTHSEKIMIKTITKKNLDFIKNGAYMYRLHKISHNDSNDKSSLIEVVYSMAYLNLLGYYEKDKDIILKNLLNKSIQNSVFTRHTYEGLKNQSEMRNHNHLLSFMIDYTSIEWLIKDRYGDLREYKVVCDDEKYFEKGCLFKKTYIVSIDM